MKLSLVSLIPLVVGMRYVCFYDSEATCSNFEYHKGECYPHFLNEDDYMNYETHFHLNKVSDVSYITNASTGFRKGHTTCSVENPSKYENCVPFVDGEEIVFLRKNPLGTDYGRGTTCTGNVDRFDFDLDLVNGTAIRKEDNVTFPLLTREEEVKTCSTGYYYDPTFQQSYRYNPRKFKATVSSFAPEEFSVGSAKVLDGCNPVSQSGRTKFIDVIDQSDYCEGNREKTAIVENFCTLPSHALSDVNPIVAFTAVAIVSFIAKR